MQLGGYKKRTKRKAKSARAPVSRWNSRKNGEDARRSGLLRKIYAVRGGIPVTTESKVGAFVIGCFSVLAFTLIYLINAQFGGHTVPYRTYLRYAGGLEPGASVLSGGITVGSLTAVSAAASDPTKIENLLDVKNI